MKKFEHKFLVKPLSANRMFGRKGRTTFKTAEYLDFQNEIRDELMGTPWPFGAERVSFHIEAQFSNKGADLDNMIKPLLDTFQSIYGEFNDKEVYHITLEKKVGKRGDEYISVRIEPHDTGADGSEVPPARDAVKKDESKKPEADEPLG